MKKAELQALVDSLQSTVNDQTGGSEKNQTL